MDSYAILSAAKRLRVSDGKITSILDQVAPNSPLLLMIWPQLGDFDSIEYAWWVVRAWEQLQSRGIQVRAVGIGDRTSGQTFCQFTGFPETLLWMDESGSLHHQLNLYPGLQVKVPGLSAAQNAWVNLLLMCAGIGSPGTLAEVFRGYRGDRDAPQLIAPDETIQASPLPALKGRFFDRAGGSGFQRPFELATLRLRNMVEVLGDWKSYVPDASFITQRGGTFLWNGNQKLVYEYRDEGILGFSATMNNPLDFIWSKIPARSEQDQNSTTELETSR